MKKILSCVALALAVLLVVPFAAVGCKKENTRSGLAGVYTFDHIDISVDEEPQAAVVGDEEVAVLTDDDPNEMMGQVQEFVNKVFSGATITLNLNGVVETNMFDLLLASPDVLDYFSEIYGQELPEGMEGKTLGDMLDEFGAKVTYGYRWVPFNNYAVMYGEVKILDKESGETWEMPEEMAGNMGMFYTMLPYITNALQYLDIEGNKTKHFDYQYTIQPTEGAYLNIFLTFNKTANAKKVKVNPVTDTKKLQGKYTLDSVDYTILNQAELEEQMGEHAEDFAQMLENVKQSGPAAFKAALEGMYFELDGGKAQKVKTNLFELLFALLDEEVGEPDMPENPAEFTIERDMVVYMIQMGFGDYAEEFGIANVGYDYTWTPDNNNVAVLFGNIEFLNENNENIFDGQEGGDVEEMKMASLAIPGFFRTVTAKNGVISLTYEFTFPYNDMAFDLSLTLNLKK